MAITSKGDRRKGIERESDQRQGEIEKVKIAQEGGKDQEVIVRHEAVPPKEASSVWSWHEEFTAAWCETFITEEKKSRKMTREGERNG